jgi:RND superfamily putative drug exporter
VQVRPKAFGLIALAVLTAVALPTLTLRLGAADDGNLPTSSTNRQAYDMSGDGFGPGFNGSLVLAVQAPIAADRAAETQLADVLAKADGVASVSAAPMAEGQTVGAISVVPTTSPQSEATSDLIDHLRATVIPPVEQGTLMKVYVGGTTASSDDFASVLMGKLPVFLLVIAVLGFVLLTVAFWSLLIPAVGALPSSSTASESACSASARRPDRVVRADPRRRRDVRPVHELPRTYAMEDPSRSGAERESRAPSGDNGHH